MSLDKTISKFIGYDCLVCKANGFAYFPSDLYPLITYCLEEPVEANREWKKFLKENFNFDLTAENLFSMSILHELGHHYTINFFSSEEWETQATEKALEGIEDPIEYYRAYFKLPIEYAATTWAVDIYNLNKKNMRSWNHRFYCALRHYEKKHKIKNSLLTKL